MDLKMNIDLKNINMEDIKAKVLQLADKKTLIKIGISAGAIILFLMCLMVVFVNILNTGCALYPVHFTCLNNFSWTISKRIRSYIRFMLSNFKFSKRKR